MKDLNVVKVVAEQELHFTKLRLKKKKDFLMISGRIEINSLKFS